MSLVRILAAVALVLAVVSWFVPGPYLVLAVIVLAGALLLP